ncbi:quinone-dependent dihydroorotate dehydrogenase [Leptospira interrogans]
MLKLGLELARPLLLALEPEQAHEVTLKSLEAGLFPHASEPDDPRLAVNVWDLHFPNPIGIAAGFDKDARVPDAILKMGCGFAEAGSITPLPQSGNPKPRVFRLIAERAVINRLGFNNGGHAAALARLRSRPQNGIVGVNIGANKDAADRTADYVRGVETFYDLASYLAINISSPNTPGLRDLQAPAALDELLGRVLQAREHFIATGARKVPIVVKIAPDIAEDDLALVVERLIANGVDGISISNTTLTRPALSDTVEARETGGLSGRPLFHRSTVMLARVHRLTGGRIPLIGIGGIDSPETALSKIVAGATLLQLYTGLIYEGPGLIGRIKQGLLDAMTCKAGTSLACLTGTKSEQWANKPLDP